MHETYGCGINDYIKPKASTESPNHVEIMIIDATLGGNSANIVLSKENAKTFIENLRKLL